MITIRVILADDHPVVRAGVRSLLDAAPDLEFAGEASDGIAALHLMSSIAPDVAVIDVSMHGLSGAELARKAAAEYPHVRVLVLTMHEDRAHLQSLLEAGARGYVLKRSAADELVRAIRSVYMGGLYIDPAVAQKLIPPTQLGKTEASAELSEREETVLRFTARGFSNKETAAKLNLSVKTVETYRARGAEKLGLHTRAKIVRYGAAQGWLDDC